MVEKRVLKEIEARLVKLKDGIDATIEKPLLFTNFFYSEEGKKLGRSIADLTNFSMKTGTLFFPFDDLMTKLRKSLHSEQLDDEIQKSINPMMSEGYRNLLSDFLPRYSALLDDGDINPPFPIKDMGRFLVLHVLSLYSYLDVYADEMMYKLMINAHYLNKMVKILETDGKAIIRLKDLRSYVDNKENALVKTVRRNLPRNLLAKIDFIITIIGLKEDLVGFDGIIDTTIYRKVLSKLVAFRNTFAHGEPCPNINILLDSFKDAPIKDTWRGFLKSLNLDSDGPFTRSGIYDMMMEFLVEQSPMFSMILKTMIISLMYPLIVDTAISVILIE